MSNTERVRLSPWGQFLCEKPHSKPEIFAPDPQKFTVLRAEILRVESWELSQESSTSAVGRFGTWRELEQFPRGPSNVCVELGEAGVAVSCLDSPWVRM